MTEIKPTADGDYEARSKDVIAAVEALAEDWDIVGVLMDEVNQLRAALAASESRVSELEATVEAVEDRLDELITNMHNVNNQKVSSDVWGTELEDCRALLSGESEGE